jgi:hypothetical protein
VRIYKEKICPANHFILSIHDLTKTDLKKLDDLTHRYLKSWLGMPHGCEKCLASLQREPVPGNC